MGHTKKKKLKLSQWNLNKIWSAGFQLFLQFFSDIGVKPCVLKRLCDFVNINEPTAKKYSEILSYKWKANSGDVKNIFGTKNTSF
jgi:hypothetical protein